MCVALAVPRTLPNDWRENMAAMCRLAAEAARAGAQLIVFSEAATTGFVNTGNLADDLPLGQTIPGPATDELAQVATEHSIAVAFGLYERDGDSLYDRAVLLSPTGELALRYRRIDSHWRHPRDDPRYYRTGQSVSAAMTPIGRCAFLLCGDLFNDECRRQTRELSPDWVLAPMARCFDEDCRDAATWAASERYSYAECAAQMQAGLLLVNQWGDYGPGQAYFGGALVVSADGAILAEHPLQQEGVLLVEWRAG